MTRAFVRFQKRPSSVRYASAAIVSTILFLVLAGAAVIQILSPDEYPNYGEALWFTLQTVTTVGYGDSTPTSGIGRFVASVVMLVSIALITVATAAITSMLIQSISRPQNEAEQLDFAETLARIEASLAAAQEQLDQLTDAMTSDTDGRHDTR